MDFETVLNFITIDRFIALASSVAAVLAAFATYLTVIEMQKQRRSSYRPTLVFKNSGFMLYRINSQKQRGYSRKHIISNEEDDTVKRKLENDDTPGVEYEYFNIGVGAAKEIKVFTSTDYELFRHIINELDVNNRTKVIIERSTDKYGGALTIDSEEVFFVSQIDAGVSTKDQYILPFNMNSAPYQISMPSYYEQLILLVYTLSRKISTNYWSRIAFSYYHKIPPLMLRIEYKDIEGNIHNQTFTVSHSINIAITTESNKELERVMEGRYVIREINVRGIR